MKKILLSVIFLLTLLQGYSQTRGISYQAVILSPDDQEIPGVNAQGNILANSAVSIQFTIVDATNNEEYQEYHTTSTDMYGMINLFIGNGAITSSNNFEDIVWDGTTKMLNVAIDFSGNGSNFTPLSVQHLSYMPQPLNNQATQLIAEIIATQTLIEQDLSGIATNASDISDIQAEQTTQNNAIALNTAKETNVDHPLVETAVPVGALFTDTVYDATALQAEVDLNTAKETNVDHPLVETAVPVGALFTDTVYDATALQAEVDLNTAKETNVDHPLVETAVPVGALFTDTVYDATALQAEVDLNTAKETNVDHPLVESAVPVGALFTDTVYDATALQAEVDLNTAKETNVDHPLVESAVPVGALFTDTVYDATALQAEVDLNTAKETNVDHPLVESAVPSDALFTDTVYDATALQAEVDLNTAKVSYPGAQDISTDDTAGNLSLSDGSTLTLNVDDADADPTNEKSDLSLIGNILTLSNPTTALNQVNLSGFVNTDTQLTEAEVDAFANNNGYLTFITETDPVFIASQAASITAQNITDLGNLSGTNTGDQDLSTLATKTALDDSTAQVRSEIPDVSGFLTSYTETDPSVPTGTQTGEMQYWNGTAWVTVATTENEGATLQMLGGVPTWTGGTLPNVTNPTTGEIWMDRNLGASQVAISWTDSDAYGDLYQWGRGTDGHEIRTSSTTSTLATSDNPSHGDFITNGSVNTYDWRNPQNDNLWQGVSGINNPCPSGYRLPTEAEWEDERASWGSNNAEGAFGSPLKLPRAGYRNYGHGSVDMFGTVGWYWSSTVSSTHSRYLDFP